MICMGGREGAYGVFVGKPKGKKPFGRPGCRWEDSIEMDLQKWHGEKWSGLIWLRMGTGGRCL